MRIPRSMLVLTSAMAIACADTPYPTEAPVDLAVAAEAGGVLGKVSGGGHYEIDLGGGLILPTQFAMQAKQTDPDGTAQGTFHHRLELFGEAIEFSGEVTCLTFDAQNGRAWVGGVVTNNNSVREPFASGEIYQPGKDIWFRVLDVGPPSAGVDRTTFTGFEGGGGIITSAEYCDAQIWPDGNARTNPLTAGNLSVMP